MFAWFNEVRLLLLNASSNGLSFHRSWQLGKKNKICVAAFLIYQLEDKLGVNPGGMSQPAQVRDSNLA